MELGQKIKNLIGYIEGFERCPLSGRTMMGQYDAHIPIAPDSIVVVAADVFDKWSLLDIANWAHQYAVEHKEQYQTMWDNDLLRSRNPGDFRLYEPKEIIDQILEADRRIIPPGYRPTDDSPKLTAIRDYRA